MTLGGGFGFRTNNGDEVHESIALGCLYGYFGQSQSLTSAGFISGSLLQGCLYAGYQGSTPSTRFATGINRLMTQTSRISNASDFVVGQYGTGISPSVLWSYNGARRFAEACEPTLRNVVAQGKGNSFNDTKRNYIQTSTSTLRTPVCHIDTDILGRPREMGIATASFHHIPTSASKRDLGPYEYSNVDHTGSYQSSGPGIEIQGEGVQIFDKPVPSGWALSISVATKWKSGATAESKRPGIILSYKNGFYSSSIHTGDSFQNYFTGSQLTVTSSYATAAANTWQTIELSRSVDDSVNNQIYTLQLQNQNSGSDSWAIFSDLEIS